MNLVIFDLADINRQGMLGKGLSCPRVHEEARPALTEPPRFQALGEKDSTNTRVDGTARSAPSTVRISVGDVLEALGGLFEGCALRAE